MSSQVPQDVIAIIKHINANIPEGVRRDHTLKVFTEQCALNYRANLHSATGYSKRQDESSAVTERFASDSDRAKIINDLTISSIGSNNKKISNILDIYNGVLKFPTVDEYKNSIKILYANFIKNTSNVCTYEIMFEYYKFLNENFAHMQHTCDMKPENGVDVGIISALYIVAQSKFDIYSNTILLNSIKSDISSDEKRDSTIKYVQKRIRDSEEKHNNARYSIELYLDLVEKKEKISVEKKPKEKKQPKEKQQKKQPKAKKSMSDGEKSFLTVLQNGSEMRHRNVSEAPEA